MNTQNKIYCFITGKKCYTRKEAAQVINNAHKRYRTGFWNHFNKKIPERMYYCNHCQSFHLTSEGKISDQMKKNKIAKQMKKIS